MHQTIYNTIKHILCLKKCDPFYFRHNLSQMLSNFLAEKYPMEVETVHMRHSVYKRIILPLSVNIQPA